MYRAEHLTGRAFSSSPNADADDDDDYDDDDDEGFEDALEYPEEADECESTAVVEKKLIDNAAKQHIDLTRGNFLVLMRVHVADKEALFHAECKKNEQLYGGEHKEEANRAADRIIEASFDTKLQAAISEHTTENHNDVTQQHYAGEQKKEELAADQRKLENIRQELGKENARTQKQKENLQILTKAYAELRNHNQALLQILSHDSPFTITKEALLKYLVELKERAVVDERRLAIQIATFETKP